jgi:hypothetical protein
MASSPPQPRTKFVPRVALVQLDSPANETLTKAFAQCGIQTVPMGEDFAHRLVMEKLEGCVVQLDEQAPRVLEAVRSSRSNRRMILYGICSSLADIRRFSKYGINAFLNSPLDRSAVLNTARSTCALLLNELRLYVRIPLVIDISIEAGSRRFSGSSREVSGGGMSIELADKAPLAEQSLRLVFTLPEKPPISVGATICWQNGSLTGFQFQDGDPARQKVKDWINSFLGLD